LLISKPFAAVSLAVFLASELKSLMKSAASRSISPLLTPWGACSVGVGSQSAARAMAPAIPPPKTQLVLAALTKTSIPSSLATFSRLSYFTHSTSLLSIGNLFLSIASTASMKYSFKFFPPIIIGSPFQAIKRSAGKTKREGSNSTAANWLTALLTTTRANLALSLVPP